MYLETYSMEELMELIEEKGYCSVEAVEILKEMEQSQRRGGHTRQQHKRRLIVVPSVYKEYYEYRGYERFNERQHYRKIYS